MRTKISTGTFEPSQRPAFTVLDLGTTYAKALVVTTDGQRGEVWGVGRRRLRGLRRGRVADVAAVAMACETALCQAEDMTLRTCGVTLVPDHAILGLSGAVIHTVITPVKTQRPQPDERVRTEELHSLAERALRLARVQAEQTGPVELVQAEPLSVTVDGHRVSDVTRFRGRELGLALFFAFIPQVQVQSLQRLRRRLELDIVTTVAGPLALATARREDGIFIDLGGAATDLILVRNEQLAATSHFPSGSTSLDRELGRHLELTPVRAELVKLSYEAGQLDGRTAQTVAAVCQREATIWLESLQPILRRFSDGHPLPASIWLCGGGSQLDEVLQACHKFPWMQRLAFARYPQVQHLGPIDVPAVLDRTGGKLTTQDVPALALAQGSLSRPTAQPTVSALARTLTL
jgi:cell division protein FtsA